MNKGFFVGAVLLCGIPQVSGAQESLTLEGVFEGIDLQTANLHVNGTGDTTAEVKMEVKGSAFEGRVRKTATGFYKLYGNNNGAQLMVPLYLPDAESAKGLRLSVKDGCPFVETGKDNQALSAFNALTYTKGRLLWFQGGKMDSAALLSFLKGYTLSADSIIRHYACTAPVDEYLKLWAYVTAYNDYLSLSRIPGRSSRRPPFPLSEVLEDAEKVLDCPMSVFFNTTPSIVYSTLPKASLEECLTCLYERYTNAELRRKVEDLALDSYLMRFDFETGDFEAGLSELEAIVSKYGLDKSYVDKFKARKSSVKGEAFPADVTLVDMEGNKMDFSVFKGYYVYVDLWASWCGPCCREVPYLQELERKLENQNVKFLSISLDRNEKAWKDKMEALDMHGNQWLNSDDKLSDALNVKGIPHFLIYDKDGRLYRSDAPRPSNPALKDLLEGLH